ncbi:hypothetical protein [Cytophaga aurantiaca]|uniref:hypothetical protein n=1 Tax=Cytophaga aurantiaca TaxID=29530 RepID=UPI0003641863|nr:hypothetical protein [Cytophaga aurantiaca]
MNQKMLFLLAALMPAMIFSCKRNNEPTPSVTYPNFSQLKVGNYWIYEQFDISSTGDATSRNIFDSCYVEKDTIIKGNTYFKIVKPLWYDRTKKEVLFQRDSLHYIVNSNGEILFSSQDFTNALEAWYIISPVYDTISRITRKMTDKGIAVSTFAGTFKTLNAQETHAMYPMWTSAGNPRYRDARYAKNVGIVIETLLFFVSSPDYAERRLVRYHLN